jgi:hypothetical protein
MRDLNVSVQKWLPDTVYRIRFTVMGAAIRFRKIAGLAGLGTLDREVMHNVVQCIHPRYYSPHVAFPDKIDDLV